MSSKVKPLLGLVCSMTETVVPEPGTPTREGKNLRLSLLEQREAYSLKGITAMSDTQKLAVFVPASAAVPIARIVAGGSAIVGKADSDEAEQVTVDFEGNLYEAANIKTFADRARHAAGRKTALYPTVARQVVSRSHLRQVGWFDERAGITLLDGAEAQEALASWLGMEMIEEKELHFSS
jgi:hypothetical protein